MKKIIVILSILSIVLVQSCSNEFELTENWKDITIIYGLLDASDTAQYIRVEKAFLDESTSALTIAQDADSIFYNDITVSLQAIPPPGSGGGGFFTLERVDANLEGYTKDEGVFASTPNYVYKFSQNLIPSFRYEILVKKGDNDINDVTAATEVIGDFAITFPPQDYDELNFSATRDLQVRWNKDEDAAFYDGIMRIYYTEALSNDPTNVVSKTLDWALFRNLPKSNDPLMIHIIDGVSFYKFLQSNLEAGNFIREFISADVFVYAGGHELDNYVNAGRASAGITSAETLPVYTNVNNGLGIFSTRYTQSVTNILAKQAMKDTLSSGPYTSELGFK